MQLIVIYLGLWILDCTYLLSRRQRSQKYTFWDVCVCVKVQEKSRVSQNGDLIKIG